MREDFPHLHVLLVVLLAALLLIIPTVGKLTDFMERESFLKGQLGSAGNENRSQRQIDSLRSMIGLYENKGRWTILSLLLSSLSVITALSSLLIFYVSSLGRGLLKNASLFSTIFLIIAVSSFVVGLLSHSVPYLTAFFTSFFAVLIVIFLKLLSESGEERQRL